MLFITPSAPLPESRLSEWDEAGCLSLNAPVDGVTFGAAGLPGEAECAPGVRAAEGLRQGLLWRMQPGAALVQHKQRLHKVVVRQQRRLRTPICMLSTMLALIMWLAGEFEQGSRRG